jgi:tyrosyl-tRNA synthetase
MKLSEELIYRGMVAQNTFADITDLDRRKRRFYFGVDPSQASMTIGNLAALMMCKVFIRHGYEPYLLVGGATGQIGDPKMDKERAQQTTEQIASNARGIHDQFVRIMGSRQVHLVNNLTWFKNINYIDFLGEIGRQFSMTQLLDRDFVKSRIGEGGSGISYAEFSYSLIQGYDFLWLYRHHGIDLQLCGADQYGNCISGLHLIKRLEDETADVWSLPLTLDSHGKKLGKSEGNAIWLDAERTKVFDFYQFWLNVDDSSVESYLKIYTEIAPSEIDEIIATHRKNPAARAAQKALALGATEIVHGRANAVNAAHITNVLFNGEDISELPPAGLELLETTIPTVVKNTTVIKALVETGLCTSNSQAIKLIEGGGVSLAGQKITADQPVRRLSIIKKGKNQFILVK